MTPADSSISEQTFDGGELCLNFTNTVEWHASDSPQERLKTYDDLVAWGVQTDILGNASARRLLREASSHPSQAQAVLKRAMAVRESMYRIFVAVVSTQSPNGSDLETVNVALSKALRHLRVSSVDGQYAWEWMDSDCDLDRILWPVLRSAADLLTSDKLMRIGQCADDRGCGWLFLDSSKNRSRRWCAMDDCGNRAKALRHYRRARQSGPRKRS